MFHSKVYPESDLGSDSGLYPESDLGSDSGLDASYFVTKTMGLEYIKASCIS